MTARLAAQMLSESEAESLEFCLKNNNFENFEWCEASIKFLKVFNRVFDILMIF